MQIRESAEDYLEAILVLSRKGGGVRSVDIATMLGVSYRDTDGERCRDCQQDL